MGDVPTQNVVIVDRVVFGTKPDYCIHGHSTCIKCHGPVWLGSETTKAVLDGALPLCLSCVRNLSNLGLITSDQRTGHLRDHLRADGPHDD